MFVEGYLLYKQGNYTKAISVLNEETSKNNKPCERRF